MSEDELYNELKKWFDSKWGKPNTFNRSKIARLIKNRLRGTGHFKNAPRGNPRKAKNASDNAKAKKMDGENISACNLLRL